VINYNTPIVVLRQTNNGEIRLEMKGIIGGESIHLPVDADIEEGDCVERLLPNGKVQELRITKVDVHQSPFGSTLDHTEAKYTTGSAEAAARRMGDTFNVQATNVQVATGDRSQQTMTVGQTAEQLVLVMQGISETLGALGLTHGREAQLAEVQAEAIADVTSGNPTAGGVRRFYEWVMDCVKEGGTAAVVAAITAASNALLTDAEALSKVMGS